MPLTVGAEEELMLVESPSLSLAPAIDDVLPTLGDDPRFRREQRPEQLEIVTRVCETPSEVCRELAGARRFAVERIGGAYRLLAAGTHPVEAAPGTVTQGERYRQIAAEYVWVTTRSLVCGLHVHVAVGDPDRALAVYNALRSYLPELAALGANSAFFDAVDTGMASMRPKLNQFYPRSGVPPSFETWDAFVRFLDWGRHGGLFPDASHLWWDLRPHPAFGTLELRVADTQTRVEDTGAIVAVAQALVARLGERFDNGEPLPVHRTCWIEENAWRAHRYGVHGELVDLDTGRSLPARERLAGLLDDLEPYAGRFAASEHLAAARTLLAGNGADRQRYVHEREGLAGLTRWLVAETERADA